jgi:predicted metal-binding protein
MEINEHSSKMENHRVTVCKRCDKNSPVRGRTCKLSITKILVSQNEVNV